MTALIPMAMYGLEVPAGDIAISARPDIPSAFRITMAAIDPTAEPETEEGEPIRATLKVIRQPLALDNLDEDDDSDDDSFDAEEMDRILADDEEDEEDEDDDEDLIGGPSDPAKSKKARVKAKIMQLLGANGDMDVDEDDEDDVDDEELANGLSAKAKGKLPAGEDVSDSDESDDSDEFEGEIEEYVICTLDPTKNCQQTLDITFGEDERVWFKVTGSHSIHLTGNYVETIDDRSRLYDPSDDEEDEYDLEPDSDELEDMYDDEDELDDLDDVRIEEVEDDEVQVPKLVPLKSVKGNNKRTAPEDDAMETLDEMIAAEKTNGEKVKKQQKKQKKNDGTAIAVEKKENEVPSSSKAEKKVAFAKELEQGPTPTKVGEKPKAALGVKVVQGVTIDDKKLGTGPATKAGDRVGMRYIGKLKDGKVFDSNKKGKPFSFKLGAGDVIKGWDIGIAGMSVGGERRITIPAHLGYGSRGAPPSIPPNAQLIFDVKLLEMNKGK